ncbi:MAG: LuxR C-terminal-related transcriptional regulator [Betaproteobacteria bacterium]
MLDLSEFLLALYKHAREMPMDLFPDAALEKLKIFVRFDSARWGSGILTGKGVVRHCTHRHCESAEATAAYDEVKSQDLASLEIWRSPPGFHIHRIHSRTHFGAKEHSGIREYALKFGHENTILAAHRRFPDSLMNYVAIYRAAEKERFQERDEGFLRVVMPHLLEAQALNRVLNFEKRFPNASAINYRLCIADSHGVLILCDPAAMALMEAEWPGSGMLRLPALLLDALTAKGRFCGQKVVVATDRIGELLFVRIRPVCAIDSLSPRELAVAREIARGCNHKRIGKALNISPFTARNHIQAIHNKLNVKNSIELVSALSRIEYD